MTIIQYFVFGVPILAAFLIVIHNHFSIRFFDNSGQLLAAIKNRLSQLEWDDDEIEKIFLPGIATWMLEAHKYRLCTWGALVSSIVLFYFQYDGDPNFNFSASIWLSAAIILFWRTSKHVYLVHGVIQEYEEMLEAAEELYEDNDAQQH